MWASWVLLHRTHVFKVLDLHTGLPTRSRLRQPETDGEDGAQAQHERQFGIKRLIRQAALRHTFTMLSDIPLCPVTTVLHFHLHFLHHLPTCFSIMYPCPCDYLEVEGPGHVVSDVLHRKQLRRFDFTGMGLLTVQHISKTCRKNHEWKLDFGALGKVNKCAWPKPIPER